MARRARASVAALALGALTVGCAPYYGAAVGAAPDAYAVLPAGLDESLFQGDTAVLSNEAIERILAAEIDLDTRHRLAVLRLGPPRAWSRETADIEDGYEVRLLERLARVEGLERVRAMPGLLVPQRKTVAYLREAAARLQCDLLLVHFATVRTFEKDRLFSRDEVRAICSVEAVLIDVRSGFVPMTTEASEDFSAEKSSEDKSFAETIARASAEATGRALLAVAEDVAEFLSGG